MGVRVPQSVSEYSRFGVDFGVECLVCGRIAVFDAGAVAIWLVAHGRKSGLPADLSAFRCRCGSRRLCEVRRSIDLRPDPLPIRAPVLRPLYIYREGRSRR